MSKPLTAAALATRIRAVVAELERIEVEAGVAAAMPFARKTGQADYLYMGSRLTGEAASRLRDAIPSPLVLPGTVPGTVAAAAYEVPRARAA